MFVGIGVGIGRQRFAGGFADSYSARVLADGGTIESLSCVANASTLLQQASLLFIPSGYKAGVAFSALPNNGNGDLTWTRNSTAYRTQSNGNIGSVGANVPRLDYTYGSCPSALLEPQRTNVGINTIWAGGVPPTSWQLGNSNGTITAVTSNLGNDATALRFANSGGGSLNVENTIVYTATNYVISFYIESISGTLTYQELVRLTGGPNITSSGFFLNQVSVSGSSQVQVGRFEYRFTLGTGATHGARIGSGTGLTSPSANTLILSRPQFEVGAYATTYIPTTTASATRLADTFTRNNIYTNGLISASGGTWFVELKNNVAYVRDSVNVGLFIGDDTTNTNGFAIRNLSTGRLAIQKFIATVNTNLYNTLTDSVKIAIKWNGTTADVFVNGVKVVSSSVFTTTIMQYLSSSSNTVIPTFIQKMALYNEPKSDQFCIDLTT